MPRDRKQRFVLCIRKNPSPRDDSTTYSQVSRDDCSSQYRFRYSRETIGYGRSRSAVFPWYFRGIPAGFYRSRSRAKH